MSASPTNDRIVRMGSHGVDGSASHGSSPRQVLRYTAAATALADDDLSTDDDAAGASPPGTGRALKFEDGGGGATLKRTISNGASCRVSEHTARAALDSRAATVVMVSATLFALFGDDLRLSVTTVDADNVFYGLSLFAFLLFTAEITVNCIVRPNFFGSFYFWLDVLATVTLVPDIGWWWCAMVQCGELGSAVTDTGSEAFRAGRASRATSRAGRILRFIRLVRLVRIVKLYKHVRKQEAVLEVLRLKTFSAEELRAKFKAIDKDRNNVLDKTEVEMLFEDAFISTGQAAPPGAAAEFMQRLDKNGDGHIDYKEFEDELMMLGEARRREELRLNAHKNSSNIGRRLSDVTTRRVIVLTLLLLFAVPVFSLATWDETASAHGYGLELLHRVPQRWRAPGPSDAQTDAARRSVRQYATTTGDVLLYLTLCERPTACAASLDNAAVSQWLSTTDAPPLHDIDVIRATYRPEEVTALRVAGCFDHNDTLLPATDAEMCTSRALFDNRDESRLDAVLSIALTLFVILVLGSGSYQFTRAANSLVIEPIERMVSTVEQLARTPLMKLVTHKGATSIEPMRGLDSDSDSSVDSAAGDSARMRRAAHLRRGSLDLGNDVSVAPPKSYETRLLEDTLTKFAALMQCGFGQAGSRIVAHNLRQTAGELDPLVPGRRVEAIFGFCDIRDFTRTTECLQEEIMVFTNTVARIVHECAHIFGGNANKNVGDSFLLVWRQSSAAGPLFPHRTRTLDADGSASGDSRSDGDDDGRGGGGDAQHATDQSPAAPGVGAGGGGRGRDRLSILRGAGGRALGERSGSLVSDGFTRTDEMGLASFNAPSPGDGRDRAESLYWSFASDPPAGTPTTPGTPTSSRPAMARPSPGMSPLAYAVTAGGADAGGSASDDSDSDASALRSRVPSAEAAAASPLGGRATQSPSPVVSRSPGAGSASARVPRLSLKSQDWGIAVSVGELPRSAAHRRSEAGQTLAASMRARAAREAAWSPRRHRDTRGDGDAAGDPDDRYSMSSGGRPATLADDALCAFLKMVVEIGCNADLDRIAAEMVSRQVFPEGHKVRLGFGLHAGWAIEGAVGSIYKIDATYLSGDVNLASRLEAATKQYGTDLLMSHVFYRLLSKSVRRYCRRIDVVTVVGSAKPLGLSTCDVVVADPSFDSIIDIPKLQVGMTPSWRADFERGARDYLAGQWSRARRSLLRAQSERPGDGPTATLLSVMAAHNWAAPADWAGYRALESK